LHRGEAIFGARHIALEPSKILRQRRLRWQPIENDNARATTLKQRVNDRAANSASAAGHQRDSSLVLKCNGAGGSGHSDAETC
jgi:hypothetical protein